MSGQIEVELVRGDYEQTLTLPATATLGQVEQHIRTHFPVPNEIRLKIVVMNNKKWECTHVHGIVWDLKHYIKPDGESNIKTIKKLINAGIDGLEDALELANQYDADDIIELITLKLEMSP